MKVLICPICGGINFEWNPWLGGIICYDCKKEIIPLATPQETGGKGR